ncbi:MAG: TatD family hydrolase [Chloroflexi bacterium]|nr:TatD family hydrolase [Chloroflexota bacterium]MDA1147774.1 TatD family hydrolase [Chloroflexota bacterium]
MKPIPLDAFPTPLQGTIDAHAHTWDPQLLADRPAVLNRAWTAGLEAIIEVGCDVPTSRSALALAQQDPRVHPVVGLHPHEAQHLEAQRADLETLAASGDFVAVGEIGLDFFRNISPPDQQDTAFRWQLQLARTHDLPVVIHSRDADDATYAILKDWAARVGRYLGADREIGMLHCFAGDAELAARYLELGFLISVPGTVTYPNNDRGQSVARSVPLAGMLLETDCPYLTPVPFRGRRNEPACVVETARFVAKCRGEAPQLVATATAENARRLFAIG